MKREKVVWSVSGVAPLTGTQTVLAKFPTRAQAANYASRNSAGFAVLSVSAPGYGQWWVPGALAMRDGGQTQKAPRVPKKKKHSKKKKQYSSKK